MFEQIVISFFCRQLKQLAVGEIIIFRECAGKPEMKVYFPDYFSFARSFCEAKDQLL